MKKVLNLLAMSIIIFSSNAQNVQSKMNNNLKTEKMDKENTELQSFNDYKNVEKALEPYIKSAKSGDGKLSRSAFYNHAHIIGSIEGQVYNMTADEFGGAVSESGPSENVQSHIAWIDISGPAAAAKVEFYDWNGFRFTDFFVLFKKDGEWKISGKVYDSHNKN
ncbi:nuclear transport factor 2 family protein [uncultured Aquimarina sp.]|uniref:nuclear transport factor 2 family protein n=1 Tax=uncultured Aquimarina sp. TaxID=575652 RepID=UPI002606CD24|nr:nuclear transport factor 2 family protein [uncultured Aquimarina sp.]